MPDPAPKPLKPTPPQFTLRRLLKWIFILCVLLAIGRWAYVRTWLQSQIVAELRAIDNTQNFGFHWLFEPNDLKGQGTWYGWKPEQEPPGRVVTSVTLPLPLRSEEQARHVNRLLRQLPHLQDLRLGSAIFGNSLPDRRERADCHFAIAAEGLKVRRVVFCWSDFGFGMRSAQWVRDSRYVEIVEFGNGKVLPLEGFELICEAPHVKDIRISVTALSADHLRILGTAKQLEALSLGGDISLPELEILGTLPQCELHLRVSNVSDSVLRDTIARLPNLTRLSLFLEAPSDDAVAALAKTPCLKSLTLQDTTVSDAAVMALAESPSLESLNLGGTDVSEQAIEHLARCNTLRYLQVSESLNWQRLQRELPKQIQVLPSYTPPHHKQILE
jgi:hypothetical protein